MPDPSSLRQRLLELWWNDPLLTAAIVAGLVALASTPVAFAVLGNSKWFRARRGRTLQKPEFWSVVCSMMLVMGIPAIFVLIALKSRHFDEDRYEFDPNQTLSVLDQGRQYRTLKEADEGVREERKRLEAERKTLVDQVKDLDESLLALRAVALQNPAVVPTLATVLDRLGALHRSIGLDAPQQLLEELGTPASLAGLTPSQQPQMMMVPAGTVMSAASVPAAAAPVGVGLTAQQRDLELATVPAPQQSLAQKLPLSDLPTGWTLAELDGKHLETFNAENLYEKINGRAESFIQYDVTGMAYTYYHPEADPSSEAQLYIFEMANSLKSFGKYSSEKPDNVEPVTIGADAYTSAGSVFFYQGKYYVQVITTSDDPKLADFALMVANRVAQAIDPNAPTAPLSSAPAVESASSESATLSPVPGEAAVEAEVSPDQLFKLLPAGPNRNGEKYVAQDVFGYSFLSDVFLADYQEGDTYWQGFVRPYKDADQAKSVFENYVAAVKDFGADVEELKADPSDRMVASTLDGLIDVIFLKGNTIAGANGSTERSAAEKFTRVLAESLPTKVPSLPESTSSPASAGASSYGGEP